MIVCLSVRLKELRNNKRLTQAQVAQYVGVTRAVISAYETDIRQPSYDVLIRLAMLYGVSTDYLLCIEGKVNAMLIYPLYLIEKLPPYMR